MAANSSRPVAKDPLPSYAKPNIASRLPDYTNNNGEAIRQAFAPNTYRSIKSLSGAEDEELAPFRAGTGTNATFSDFVYACSPYDLTDEVVVTRRTEHEEKMRDIGGGAPFFAGYQAHKEKFEMNGFEYVPDPYEGFRENERQQKFIEDSKALSRPFVPPGVQKALQRPTRVMLGDAMTALYRSISEDWPEVQPTILSTAEDLIVIYFLLDRVRSAAGVLTYMNNALRRNDAVLEFDLRKVNDGWNVTTEDRHLMFTLRPPWVRPRVFLDDSAKLGSSSQPQSRAGDKPQGQQNQQ